MNKSLNNKKQNPNDVIYTPLPVALDMIEKCNIEKGMKVLDPCRGRGVFYDNLPKQCIKDYCEIEEEKDFFEYNEKVDLIIGNPPYSLWNKWIEKTAELTDKFCYIMNNFNMTPVRLNKIKEFGFGLTYMKILRIDWWFAESYICIFERNKNSIIDFEPQRIKCDICGERCKRGRTYKNKKYGMNECSNV